MITPSSSTENAALSRHSPGTSTSVVDTYSVERPQPRHSHIRADSAPLLPAPRVTRSNTCDAIDVPAAPSGAQMCSNSRPDWCALEALLADPVARQDADRVRACVVEYHREALALNATRGKQTGAFLRRVIYLLSTNSHKTNEYAVLFDRYGIEVLRAPVSDDPRYLRALLQSGGKGLQVMAVHREQNALYRVDSGKLLVAPEDFACGGEVLNVSTLTVHTLAGERLARATHTASRNGTLVPDKKSQDAGVFGWDDMFVPHGLVGDPSFYELRRRGHKVSPRDMVVGEYIARNVHYGQAKDFKFTQINPRSAIDFRCSVGDYIDQVSHYNAPAVVAYGLRGMLDHVVNEGMHWRAAANRREGTYWYPGLNAGIPVTHKSDAFHQETYLFHDFGHFMIRDLIFTGHHSPRHRQVYILYRMMSEAMTMVTADMFFVDAIKSGGFEYDYGKRFIYPLFEATGLSFADPATRRASLLKLLRANVAYCVRGDDSGFRALLMRDGAIAPEGLRALEAFKSKYEPFFVEDYNWTSHNYGKMVQHAAEVRDWWRHVGDLDASGNVSFTTIDGFMRRLRPQDGDLVDQVCEAIIRDCITPALMPKTAHAPASEQARLRAAFVRYMAGQLGILSRYEALIAETPLYRRRIMDALADVLPAIDLDGVQAVRAIYEEYLTLLQQRGMITSDDFATYREVYPLFAPLYISYDRDKAAYPALAEVARSILQADADLEANANTHRAEGL